MNGPEHYREAERLLKFAADLYDDDINVAGPPGDYADPDEHMRAMEFASEMREKNIREAHMFATLGQAHATLAQAAATEDLARNSSKNPKGTR